MQLSRRSMLVAGAAALAAGRGGADSAGDVPAAERLGVIIHSYGAHVSADRRIGQPIGFLEHCHARGAGGVQVDLGARTEAEAAAIKARSEALGMYLEGSIRPPRDEADLARFEAGIRTAKLAGAVVVRTAILSGRRYETFATDAAFRKFADESFAALLRAKPVVEAQGVKLAVENHKDWRADHLVSMLRRLDSPSIGVCLDTGNSIALLEDPMEVVDALTPWTFSTHIKDMGVEPYRDGFLLSEVPLGRGFLDLDRIIRTLRSARPGLHFGLEMMTRDPLKVPCLTEKYWATFADLPGWNLARTLAMVRDHAAKDPLPRVASLSRDERLRVEDDNVKTSLAYARTHLNL
jgi:sugar phosphate isomerase/epimerase